MCYQSNSDESYEKRIENDIFTAVQEVFSNTNSNIELPENEPDPNSFYNELYFLQIKNKRNKRDKRNKRNKRNKRSKRTKRNKRNKRNKRKLLESRKQNPKKHI